jgi:hypothetical protein
VSGTSGTADVGGAAPDGGDLLRMPATFVVDRAGWLRFVHRNATIADAPPNRVLLDLLNGLAAEVRPSRGAASD